MIEATRVRRLPVVRNRVDGRAREYRVLLILALFHVPLGILIYSQGLFGLVHQVGIFGLAFYCALQKRIKLEYVAIAVAYIVGAEVLWRMASVSIYWEQGKYGGLLIFLLALLRRHVRQLPLLPILYFVVLIPACIVTLSDRIQAPETAKGVLSSTMSGPLFLAVACVFFANVEVTKLAIWRLMAAFALPLLSVAFATLFYTVSTEDIQFTGESNFATSGGFGPNQVSAMLGAGAFVALLALIIFHNSFKEKLAIGMVALFLVAQSVMTFSRGGIYAAVGATIVASLVLFREPRTAIKRLAPIVVASLIFLGLIFPFMDDVTAGSLSERFEDTQGTNRTEIVDADLAIFFENPVFGAGVGNAYGLRQYYLDRKAMSHTEFTRLLSEHGLFGALALAILITIAIRNIRRQGTIFGQAFVVGVAFWATLFMVNAGMRLAAPSFMWGLTFITIVNEKRARLGGVKRRRFPRPIQESRLAK